MKRGTFILVIIIFLMIVVFGFNIWIKRSDKCNESDKFSCKSDSDCICSNRGCFMGNIEYYKKCVDKSLNGEDCCGWVERPAACIDNQCTLDYPEEDWTFKNCNKLTSDETKDFCIGVIISKLRGSDQYSINLCEKLINEENKIVCKDDYYRESSKENEDPEICKQMSSEFLQDRCIIDIAGITEDLGICNTLREKEFCYLRVAYETGNLSICELLIPKAINELDITLDSCYETVARETENKTICEKITETTSKDYCFNWFSQHGL